MFLQTRDPGQVTGTSAPSGSSRASSRGGDSPREQPDGRVARDDITRQPGPLAAPDLLGRRLGALPGGLDRGARSSPGPRGLGMRRQREQLARRREHHPPRRVPPQLGRRPARARPRPARPATAAPPRPPVGGPGPATPARQARAAPCPPRPGACDRRHAPRRPARAGLGRAVRRAHRRGSSGAALSFARRGFHQRRAVDSGLGGRPRELRRGGARVGARVAPVVESAGCV